MLRRLLRHDLGQASIDYVTVLAVTGVALAAGTGVAMAKAPAFAGAVTGQMVRALCIVTGGDCDRDRAPCVVGSNEKTTSLGGRVLVVRLGATRTALVAERSDGKVDVTLTDGLEAGVDRSLGREARLAAMVKAKGGMSWTVGSLKEAQELIDRVGSVSSELLRSVDDGDVVSDPDEVSLEAGLSIKLSSDVKASRVGGKVALSRDMLGGARYNRRTGHAVIYLKNAEAIALALETGTPIGKAEAGGDAGRSTVMALELDRNGQPVDLMMLESGDYAGSFSLPGVASEVAGYLGVPSRLARRYEVERHLDLTRPENRRPTEAVIAAALGFEMVMSGVQQLVPTQLLAERLFQNGTVHTRTYEVDRTSSQKGFSFVVVDGAKEKHEVTSRLLAAMTRGPDGVWQERTDCVDR